MFVSTLCMVGLRHASPPPFNTILIVGFQVEGTDQTKVTTPHEFATLTTVVASTYIYMHVNSSFIALLTEETTHDF